MRILNNLLIGGMALGLIACASGHCKDDKRATDKDDIPEHKMDRPNKSFSGIEIGPGKILVYKYDGSLQCGMGQGTSVESMAKELTGIPIGKRLKKSDGMVRIQLCGSPTGMANIYEIPQKNLAEAQKRGFKPWVFK